MVRPSVIFYGFVANTWTGSWQAISWPLPRGEVRDMPHDCHVHSSVIRRMRHDPTYRPGNLIVGGGGRGCRRAPESYGMVSLQDSFSTSPLLTSPKGEWQVTLEPGHCIGEAYVKVHKTNTESVNGESVMDDKDVKSS